MAFNPSSFALTQLLSQANTASKSTDPTTTTTSTATDMSAAAAAAVAADAFRMMHANGSFGPAFGAGGFPGAGSGGQLDASAFRAMAASNGGGGGSGGMPAFAGMYPGIGPNGELLSGGGGPNGMQGFYYDALGGYPYGGGLDLNGQRRKNATRETTQPLKHWLYEHRKNPYPTKGEKIMLAIMTKMTLTQVSTWFANARRRLKKENKMTWSPRNRPGDDDDDLADDANDRPSSSLSDLSDIGNAAYDAALSRIKESADIKAETNNNHHHTGIKRRTSSPPTSTTTSPIKKNKIWSIAATLDGGATDDIVATASTSSGGVGESKSTSESLLMQQQQHAMMDNGGGGSSMISSPFAYAFSPWHQQMAAMAAASRCASANQQQFAHHPLLAAAHFRPELLAMMSRNPGVAFLPSGMLLPSSMTGANQQWPMPPIVVDHQQRRPSTSPTSSTHSHQHHRDNASKEAATVDKSS